jgi:hypothetical protein
MNLFAITLAQPWPWAVCGLGKRLENRSWTDPRLVREQWLAIHGGKMPPVGKNRRFLEFQDSLDWIETSAPSIARGYGYNTSPINFLEIEGIFAVCQIETIYAPFEGLAPRHAGQKDWRARNQAGEFDQFAWMLENLSVLKTPVKVPGKQGLWPVTGETLEQVRAEVRILQAEKSAA